jgi:A/G-specific adenine glycosylase
VPPPDAAPPSPRRRGALAGDRAAAPIRGRSFAARLIAWQARHGRHDLPWQADREPYRVWLAEVMLQQTQVGVVIPYFTRFCRRFPDVVALATAPLDDVLASWAGLGYYARARNLVACARVVVERHGGRFPLDAATLAQLPGIGRSTAGAIAAFCAEAREPILDGNVRRVLARHFGIDGDPSSPPVVRQLWQQAAALLPDSPRMPAYTQAIMDLGATVCTRRAPRCESCPVAGTCVARRTGRVDELPAPRQRRPERSRRAWTLLALHDGRVLLQRRAPTGVWGGLYSPPQFDSLAALRRTAAQLDAAPRLRVLPPRSHAFTHFTLTLLPRRLDIRSPPPRLREEDLLWLPLAELGAAPLPAPIAALLREVASPAPPQDSDSGVMSRATRKRDTML